MGPRNANRKQPRITTRKTSNRKYRERCSRPVVSHLVFLCHHHHLVCSHYPVCNPDFQLCPLTPTTIPLPALSSSKMWNTQQRPPLISHPVFLCNRHPVCNPTQISNFKLLPPPAFLQVCPALSSSTTCNIELRCQKRKKYLVGPWVATWMPKTISSHNFHLQEAIVICTVMS